MEVSENRITETKHSTEYLTGKVNMAEERKRPLRNITEKSQD